jgi:repressor LexA
MSRTADRLGKHKADHQAILDYIVSYTAAHAFPPTVREIGDAICVPSTATVSYQLRLLQRAGRLRLTPHTARSAIVVA